MQRTKFHYKNKTGDQLTGIQEAPDENPIAQVLYAHCFTCTKDIITASRISRALVKQGYAVTRFDFTGLGESAGDFEKTGFSTNIQDIISTADYLRENFQAPEILIGHSFGGAATLAAARHIPESKAIVTLAAPSTPATILAHFRNAREKILEKGEIQVEIGEKKYLLNRKFLDDADSHDLAPEIASLNKALLVLHAPEDETVDIKHAEIIFSAARYPKSFVSLDGMDHLLTTRSDAVFVANLITAWATIHLRKQTPSEQ